MVDVTEDLILRIHRKVILSGKPEEAPLCDSVLDRGCLYAICYGATGMTDPIEKSAYFLQRLSTRHAFFEGNKRTSFVVADMILRYELGCTIIENEDENYNFVKRMINEDLTLSEVSDWIEEHIIRLNV